jgi:hypothetical protein
MQITSEEIIRLKTLKEKGLAKLEVVGEILPNGIDERTLKVSRPSFCQYTGAEGERCEYHISFFDLRNIWSTCDKQKASLLEQIGIFDKTVEVIREILDENKPEKKPAKEKSSAPSKNTASR